MRFKNAWEIAYFAHKHPKYHEDKFPHKPAAQKAWMEKGRELAQALDLTSAEAKTFRAGYEAAKKNVMGYVEAFQNAVEHA